MWLNILFAVIIIEGLFAYMQHEEELRKEEDLRIKYFRLGFRDGYKQGRMDMLDQWWEDHNESNQ